MAYYALIPSDDIVATNEDRTIRLDLKFLHPMEGHYMDMARPERFAVIQRGTPADLTETLQPAAGKGGAQQDPLRYWTTEYTINRPGDLTFYFIPKPYWEPAEDLYIIHFTKVCVSALGLYSGCEEPVGLETEIVPLTRPYGLWTGNVFSGRVLLRGQPVPFAEIEVEYLNESQANPAFVTAPSDAHITQVIRADENGVFHYAMPRAGWWGFSALSEAGRTLPHEGIEKNIEIGAVFWIHTVDMP